MITQIKLLPPRVSKVAQPRDQELGSYRKPNAHSSGEGTRNELALVKLDQQRCLPHAAVSDQDRLQGPGKEESVHGSRRCPSLQA